MAVDAADDGIAFGADLDARDVLDPHRRAVGQRLQYDILELGNRLHPRLRRDGRVEHLSPRRRQAPDVARRDLAVLRGDRRNHVVRHQRRGGEPLRIEPDTHRVRRAEDIDLAYSLDARQRVLDVRRHIVGHVLVYAGVGLVIDADEQQRVRVRFGHAHALRLHLLRQARDRRLDLVLHLHLRDVGVGALLEDRGDARLPARARLRAEIEEAVDPRQLLLEHLRDAVLDRLGRGAGIGRADIDLRRRDVGILLDRQRKKRARSPQHDDDRQHPGKDRPVDE